MKRLKRRIGSRLIWVMLSALLLSIFASAAPNSDFYVTSYDPYCNYLVYMIDAAEDGSEYALTAGRVYEKSRNLKIAYEGLPVGQTDFFTRYATGSKILSAIDRYIENGQQMSPYKLTDAERNTVERAVMAEAGGESYEGQMMVAQAILDGALRKGLDVAASIKSYQIVVGASPTDSVKQAVSAVFDYGERVTEQKADLWYATWSTSTWHEAQNFVIEIGNHRFFWMNGD